MNTPAILRELTFGLALLAVPAAAQAADGFARSSGTLRAGAGSNYPAVMRVSAGAGLDVVGCISRYTWCDVAVEGERGWFPGRRIGFLRDGRRVHLSDGGGAMLGLSILTFGMDDYWGSHYADRPWYDERRWWRGHGPMPPHLSDRPRARGPGPMPPRNDTPPRVGGPEPMPPNVGSPVPRTMRIDVVKPGEPVVKSQDRIVEPPKVRAPQGVMRSDPPRNVGRTDRLQRPQMQQRQAPQGDGQLPMPPVGR